jgi:cyanate permease
VSAVGAAGITLSPILIERLIAYQEWRTAWLLEGLAVWAIVIPIAVFGIRNRPRDVGQHVDGDPSPLPEHHRTGSGNRGTAMRTPYFWVLVAGNATVGMLVTAVVFHQISLLGERGLSSAQAAANFLPQTAAGLAATMLIGMLVDRVHQPRLLIVASMALLGGGLALATVLSPGWSAMTYGAAIGAAMGSMKAVEAALTPRLFGTVHLGAIRGILAAIGVAGTAVGPVLFAVAHETTGSYTAVLLASVALPTAVGVAALTAPLPAHARR